jgi:hypothetical protein
MKRPQVHDAIVKQRAAFAAAHPDHDPAWDAALEVPEADRAAFWNARVCTVPERRAILSRWARHQKHVISAIKAIDTLNRMDGVYVEKHEHAVIVPKPVIDEHSLIEAPVAPGVPHKRG